MTTQTSSQTQTHNFQTEVKQLLHIVIHSLYSNKEIFLRELISNASDALDKLRFLAINTKELYENDPNLNIKIDFDEQTKTITVTDNGIGMGHQEVMENLGTIAKSGTKEFLSQLTGDQTKDSSLIGQFGVGFYSAFIVADKVIVKTRRAGTSADQGVRWESSGEGEYTIETITKPSRGTEISLHLKQDESEFVNDWRLRSIIHKYSDHISWPILMKQTQQESDAEKKEEASKEKQEFETVNKATALWTRTKSEITPEEYKEFYKHISHDFEEPMTWMHNHVEGKQQYISLLYLPKRAPFDLWQQDSKQGLKLFVRRIFIMDDAEQFLPRYLRFVKGVIDSSDLPLNISREILQDNKLVETIRSACVKRVLTALEKMAANEQQQYADFWREFGQVLKEGPIEDFSNREQVAKLLRFTSTHNDSDAQNISLQDYVSRMKEKQDKIYYITAENYNAAKHSPHLEIFGKNGIEVLLLHDRIDEWLVSHLSEFDGKHLQSVTKGELDLGELEQKPEQAQEQEKKLEDAFESVIKQVKTVLGEKIKEARLTHRLTSSPACIVADAHDIGREMQRILKAAGQNVPEVKPIFEINPEHPIWQRMQNEPDDEQFAQWTKILFNQSILAEGGKLEDPGQFVSELNSMLLKLMISS